MAENDHIVKDLDIGYKAQFNLIELYKSLKYWFEVNGYTFYERAYEDVIKGGKKTVKIKWQGIKRIDDYSRLIVMINLKIGNYEIIETKKEKLVDGNLKLSFAGDLESDYEEKWEDRPIWKFLRGVSDRFFTEKKRNMYENMLKDDTYDVFNKAKSFLNLYKFR
jgi:hypothetical protein